MSDDEETNLFRIGHPEDDRPHLEVRADESGGVHLTVGGWKKFGKASVNFTLGYFNTKALLELLGAANRRAAERGYNGLAHKACDAIEEEVDEVARALPIYLNEDMTSIHMPANVRIDLVVQSRDVEDRGDLVDRCRKIARGAGPAWPDLDFMVWPVVDPDDLDGDANPAGQPVIPDPR